MALMNKNGWIMKRVREIKTWVREETSNAGDHWDNDEQRGSGFGGYVEKYAGMQNDERHCIWQWVRMNEYMVLDNWAIGWFLGDEHFSQWIMATFPRNIEKLNVIHLILGVKKKIRDTLVAGKSTISS